MCIFNAHVADVSKTRIFVGATANGRQITIYENHVGAAGNAILFPGDIPAAASSQAVSKNAMILPCPLAAGSQVTLLDLSKDEFKFEDLNRCFPTYEEPPYRGLAMTNSSSPRFTDKLVVHQVGAYQMSIAPTLADLSRIDASVFTVAPNIQDLMKKHYEKGFGFIICVFDPKKEIKPHPIGYLHDMLSSKELFVPCRHEHGRGRETDKEIFDHQIFSVNTKGDEQSGLTAVEETKALEERAKREGGTVQPATKAGETVLQKSSVLKPHFPKEVVLRRKILIGKQANKDLIFTVAA